MNNSVLKSVFQFGIRNLGMQMDTQIKSLKIQFVDSCMKKLIKPSFDNQNITIH